MDNINNLSKVSNINDTSLRQQGTAKTTGTSFSDIYNIELLSAQMNRSSNESSLEGIAEVNRELRNVINNLDGNNTENIVGKFPSEDIIDLAKLMWKNTQ